MVWFSSNLGSALGDRYSLLENLRDVLLLLLRGTAGWSHVWRRREAYWKAMEVTGAAGCGEKEREKDGWERG